MKKFFSMKLPTAAPFSNPRWESGAGTGVWGYRYISFTSLAPRGSASASQSLRKYLSSIVPPLSRMNCLYSSANDTVL